VVVVMAINPDSLTVTVNERDSVTALFYAAPTKLRAGVTLILGHGAGANQLSGFMRLFAQGLAERGIDVITFNFLYMEQGRRIPDQNARLESCYRSVIEAARKHGKLKGNRVAVGGKSMGGRIGSQVAASEESGEQLAGVVLLGYPLHPPGNPEKLRDAHLKDIRAPLLFIQGSRDAFGRPEELRNAIKEHRLRAELYIVEGGDHSLKVPKSLGISQDEVYAAAMDKISGWLNLE
jgi:predicted alpha/beta-hydrolase family hydrolase